MTRNLRLDIEYDGTDFAGWAKQPGLPSIEGELERALGQVLQETVRLVVAGRTDAGVHARGQVISLKTERGIEPARLRRAVNSLLPAAIVITGAAEADPGFDARRSAMSRTYSYTVLNRPWPSAFRNRYVCWYRGTIDLALLQAAAGLIAGRHDFTAFTPTVTEHSYFEREVILSEWRREGDLLIYRIRAQSFMRNMVRALVGTMMEIGRRYRPVEDLARLLEGATRPEAGKTAPAAGLCLESIEYPAAGASSAP